MDDECEIPDESTEMSRILVIDNLIFHQLNQTPLQKNKGKISLPFYDTESSQKWVIPNSDANFGRNNRPCSADNQNVNIAAKNLIEQIRLKANETQENKYRFQKNIIEQEEIQRKLAQAAEEPPFNELEAEEEDKELEQEIILKKPNQQVSEKQMEVKENQNYEESKFCSDNGSKKSIIQSESDEDIIIQQETQKEASYSEEVDAPVNDEPNYPLFLLRSKTKKEQKIKKILPKHQTFQLLKRSHSMPNLNSNPPTLYCVDSFCRNRQRKEVINQIQDIIKSGGFKKNTQKNEDISQSLSVEISHEDGSSEQPSLEQVRKSKSLNPVLGRALVAPIQEEEKKSEGPQSLDNLSQTSTRVKDSVSNHQKLTKAITKKLQAMKINFNLDIIKQMSINEKLKLRQKIELAKQIYKQTKMLDTNKNKHVIKNNLSESDVNLGVDKNSSFRNHYQEKLIQKRKKHFKKASGSIQSQKINKLAAFKVDYDFYFNNNYGIFVVQSQMKYVDLQKIKKNRQIVDEMKNHEQFPIICQELSQENEFKNMQTLCIDIENVLIRKVNLNDKEELYNLKQGHSNRFQDYILIDKQVEIQMVIKQVNDPKLSETYLRGHMQKMYTLIRNYKSVLVHSIDQCSSSSMGLSRGYTDQSNNSHSFLLDALNDIIDEQSSFFSRNQQLDCCVLGRKGLDCICNTILYKIRPYAFDMLRAIQPFYEVIATSNMSFINLQQITNHFQILLNKPILDHQIQQNIQKNQKIQQKFLQDLEQNEILSNEQKNNLNSLLVELQERKKQQNIQKKTFFSQILASTSYIYVDEQDEYIDNLFLLTSNRKPENIVLLTSSQLRVVAAMDSGFCAIPIVKYQNFMANDFQLNLVENYLLQLRYSKNIKNKNTNDFGYLTQKGLLNNRMKSSEQDNQLVDNNLNKCLTFGEKGPRNKNSLSSAFDQVIHEEIKESSSCSENLLSSNFNQDRSLRQKNSIELGSCNQIKTLDGSVYSYNGPAVLKALTPQQISFVMSDSLENNILREKLKQQESFSQDIIGRRKLCRQMRQADSLASIDDNTMNQLMQNSEDSHEITIVEQEDSKQKRGKQLEQSVLEEIRECESSSGEDIIIQ